MKKRFFRRRSQRRPRRKADVLNFSMITSTGLIANDVHGTFNASTPATSIFPIVLGGQQGFSQTSATGAGSQLGLFLSDRAERGGTVGGFKFKCISKVGNHINTADADSSVVFSDIVYNAIVKMEYDLDQYRANGIVATLPAPNIISITKDSFGANAYVSPLSDLDADVLWRDISFGQSYSAEDPAGYLFASFASERQWYSFCQTVPWTVIRVKRFLKEDEGLFFIQNVVSGQPSFEVDTAEYVHSVDNYIYGMCAARIK